MQYIWNANIIAPYNVVLSLTHLKCAHRNQRLQGQQRRVPAALPVQRQRPAHLRLRSRHAGRGRARLPRLRRLPALLGAHHTEERAPVGREQPQCAHKALRGPGAHEERHRTHLRLPRAAGARGPTASSSATSTSGTSSRSTTTAPTARRWWRVSSRHFCNLFFSVNSVN